MNPMKPNHGPAVRAMRGDDPKKPLCVHMHGKSGYCENATKQGHWYCKGHARQVARDGGEYHPSSYKD